MSNRRKLPLILFGAVEDLSTWEKSGTPVVTGSQTDPIGGTNAYLVNDDDGAVAEWIYSPNVSLTKNINGEAIAQFFVKQGTSSSNRAWIRDMTSATTRHLISITWSGGTPTLATVSGGGTLFTPVAVGGGWWLIRFSATEIVSGNNHNLQLEPTDGVAASTGTAYFYVRSVILFSDPLDMVRAWPNPREGSDTAKAASGLEDAWIVGEDQFLGGDVRWIPGLDENTPFNRTGWDGLREVLWVNVGWESFLKFGWTKQTFTFVPDQTDADADPHTVYLTEPFSDNKPDLEDADMTRTFEITIRDSSDVPFKGY